MSWSKIATESGSVAQKLIPRNTDTTVHYDVLVVGSGMGGGVVASTLAGAGKRVLILEAGSLLFPTHIGNLPRRLLLGQFDKHVWSLWEDFWVKNFRNVGGTNFQGGQGFNLGGRSIFWGGFIPPLAKWELEAFPTAVRDYLLDPGPSGGYAVGRRVFNADKPLPTEFQTTSREKLDQALPGWNAVDAPVAVQYRGATNWSIPAGIFSTADLLIEDQLAEMPPNVGPARAPLTINLNHAATKVVFAADDPKRATGVRCFDLLDKVERTYKADTVVISAGTFESAKLALLSGIDNPKVGRGVTDHAILYRHFLIPPSSPSTTSSSPDSAQEERRSAKILLKHPGATTDSHAFDVIIELGAELNQGRYVNPAHLAQDEKLRAGYMLCEIVFQFYSPLVDANSVRLATDTQNAAAGLVDLTMFPADPAPHLVAEARDVATIVFDVFGAEALQGEGPLREVFSKTEQLKEGNCDEFGFCGEDRNVKEKETVLKKEEANDKGKAMLFTADLGGAAHEVGTLRMSEDPHSAHAHDHPDLEAMKGDCLRCDDWVVVGAGEEQGGKDNDDNHHEREDNEDGGVLDPNLAFIGYKNLYACDNSIFPVSPAGNPSLTLVALAKRLAEFLVGLDG